MIFVLTYFEQQFTYPSTHPSWPHFYQTRPAWSVDQGSNKNHSPAYNFAPTVTKFCVMWEGLSLPHDTKFGNCRCKIVDSRAFPSWSLIHGLRWSGLIKAEPGIHPSTHYIKALSVSYSMGLAAPGHEHLHVLWVNASQATITDISLHIFIRRFSRVSLLSSAGNQKVCARFDTERGPMYMIIPSEPSNAKDCHNITKAKFL